MHTNPCVRSVAYIKYADGACTNPFSLSEEAGSCRSEYASERVSGRASSFEEEQMTSREPSERRNLERGRETERSAHTQRILANVSRSVLTSSPRRIRTSFHPVEIPYACSIYRAGPTVDRHAMEERESWRRRRRRDR